MANCHDLDRHHHAAPKIHRPSSRSRRPRAAGHRGGASTLLFLVLYCLGLQPSVDAFVLPTTYTYSNGMTFTTTRSRPRISSRSGRLVILQQNDSCNRQQQPQALLFSSQSRTRRKIRNVVPGLHVLSAFFLALLGCTRSALAVSRGTAFDASTKSGRLLLYDSLNTHNGGGSIQSFLTALKTTRFESLPSLVSFLYNNKRRILWGVVAVLIAKALVNQQLTKRRQAEDATSEWGRYARNPAARGRAIFTLVFVKLLPLLTVMRVVSRKGSKQRDRLQQTAGNIFSDNLLKLGPLYIKLGQIMSCRDNLLPKQWEKSMERLQDQVPSQKGEKAQQLAYLAWPGGRKSFDNTFTDVDWTPLAAASLGQVHSAKLRATDASVALKLQRPFLREIYDQDFALLTRVAKIVDQYFGSSAGSVGGVQQSWSKIFEDAEEILYREIDYRDEASNAIRWCSAFGLSIGGNPASKTQAQSRDGKPLPSAAPWLRTPYVYGDLSTEKVLVMENVPSIKITATDKLDEANVTMEDREYLADCLGRSYLRQFCCNKFCE